MSALLSISYISNEPVPFHPDETQTMGVQVSHSLARHELPCLTRYGVGSVQRSRRSYLSNMSEIFISYERSTAGQAQIVAEALRALGYGVWLDDEVPAHRPYAKVPRERPPKLFDALSRAAARNEYASGLRLAFTRNPLIAFDLPLERKPWASKRFD